MKEKRKDHMSSCESLEDESTKVVTDSGKISLACQGDFVTLIDIALDEKVANMKDLGEEHSAIGDV